MDDLQREVSIRLGKIREIADILTQVYHQRLYTNGNVREAYTQVLSNELFRMMREVDEFKVMVCEQLADIDTEAIMNISRFPNMAQRN